MYSNGRGRRRGCPCCCDDQRRLVLVASLYLTELHLYFIDWIVRIASSRRMHRRRRRVQHGISRRQSCFVLMDQHLQFLYGESWIGRQFYVSKRAYDIISSGCVTKSCIDRQSIVSTKYVLIFHFSHQFQNRHTCGNGWTVLRKGHWHWCRRFRSIRRR